MVVRHTNQRVIVQVVWSTLTGDRVLEQANSFELAKYNLTAGLKNYCASYLTGFLLGKRLLAKVGLNKTYTGATNIDGKQYDVIQDYNALEAKGQENLRKPFKAFLDVGITRITTGNKVFGAMKGAVDAGLHIPHSVKKFPGFKKTKGNKQGEYDAEVHSARIHGNHIDDYWGQLEEENPEKAKKHFAKWQACLDKAGVESIPELFEKVLAGIKKDPSRDKSKKNTATPKREGDWIVSGNKKWLRLKKLSKEQKRQNAQKRIEAAAAKLREAN